MVSLVIIQKMNRKGRKIIREEGKWIAPGLVDTHIHGYMNPTDVTMQKALK